MFERFARESRQAVAGALDTARRQGAEQVEPEHLLLALTEGCTDPAARALAEAGLDAAGVESAIEEDLVAALDVVGVPASVVASTPAYPSPKPPAPGPALKQALELALRAAVRDGDRHIGTEHLLLGLLDPPARSLGRVLARLDVEPERLAALVRVETAAGR